MQQMKKGDNRRLMGEVWHLWESHTPEDVDGNPEYFDRVLNDIIDQDMGDPFSAAGSIYRVFLGDARNRYVWAEFMAHGVEKKILDTGVATYHLLWERLTEWKPKPDFRKKEISEPDVEDMAEEITRRGPGRPRKDEVING